MVILGKASDCHRPHKSATQDVVVVIYSRPGPYLPLMDVSYRRVCRIPTLSAVWRTAMIRYLFVCEGLNNIRESFFVYFSGWEVRDV